MLTVCWAAKGGSGTTVVAAGLGLSSHPPCLLVDLAGDLPSALGATEPEAGAHDWVLSDAAPERLIDLAVPIAPGVSLVGAGVGRAMPHAERWRLLADALATHAASAVVDAGTGTPPPGLVGAADRALLVTRSCYLALRRAVMTDVRPTGVIVVEEPGRSLRPPDVEAAVGAPVVATLTLDPAVARAIDAGLLAARLPRLIQRQLRDAA
jgi:hypothetical protein